MAGFFAYRFKFFPYKFIETYAKEILANLKPSWYYIESSDSTQIIINTPEAMDWPLLITAVGDNDSLIVKVIENDGSLINKWNIEWFEIWGDAEHLPDYIKPKKRPGTHIHGIHIFEDGSIVFNFEQCGLVRLDKSGKTLWKLPIATDHSVYFDGKILWVCAQLHHSKPVGKFSGYNPPFIEPLILKISTEGELLDKTSVLELLLENDLEGLIYSASTENTDLKLSGSIIHLNDVEPFPNNMESGFFAYGDVMLSLRNSNSIVVYNDLSKKVREVVIGGFVHQHDPDFIDGNSISIYDNYTIGSNDPERQSRIIIKTFPDRQNIVYYKGNAETPFYSSVMGKHQWLPNGNLLITESTQGRAFEINSSKEIVWEYRNVVQRNKRALLGEVSRIDPSIIKAFRKDK